MCRVKRAHEGCDAQVSSVTAWQLVMHLCILLLIRMRQQRQADNQHVASLILQERHTSGLTRTGSSTVSMSSSTTTALSDIWVSSILRSMLDLTPASHRPSAFICLDR